MWQPSHNRAVDLFDDCHGVDFAAAIDRLPNQPEHQYRSISCPAIDALLAERGDDAAETR